MTSRKNHGTNLSWTLESGARWTCTIGPYLLEIVRLNEVGSPAGWHYFGPGVPDGVHVGPSIAEAARHAAGYLGAHLNTIAHLAGEGPRPIEGTPQTSD